MSLPPPNPITPPTTNLPPPTTTNNNGSNVGGLVIPCAIEDVLPALRLKHVTLPHTHDTRRGTQPDTCLLLPSTPSSADLLCDATLRVSIPITTTCVCICAASDTSSPLPCDARRGLVHADLQAAARRVLLLRRRQR